MAEEAELFLDVFFFFFSFSFDAEYEGKQNSMIFLIRDRTTRLFASSSFESGHSVAPVEILSNPQCQGHDVDLEMVLHGDPTHWGFLPAKDPQHPLAVEGDIPQFGGLDHVFVKLILE